MFVYIFGISHLIPIKACLHADLAHLAGFLLLGTNAAGFSRIGSRRPGRTTDPCSHRLSMRAEYAADASISKVERCC
jgi:hypothetical protein